MKTGSGRKCEYSEDTVGIQWGYSEEEEGGGGRGGREEEGKCLKKRRRRKKKKAEKCGEDGEGTG